jgi:hypothetical protein
MNDDILRIPATPHHMYPGFWKKVHEAMGIWRPPENDAIALCIAHKITSDRQLRQAAPDIKNKLPAHPPRTYSPDFWKKVREGLEIKTYQWRSKELALRTCSKLGLTSLHMLTRARQSAYFRRRHATLPAHPERVYGPEFFKEVRFIIKRDGITFPKLRASVQSAAMEQR